VRVRVCVSVHASFCDEEEKNLHVAGRIDVGKHVHSGVSILRLVPLRRPMRKQAHKVLHHLQILGDLLPSSHVILLPGEGYAHPIRYGRASKHPAHFSLVDAIVEDGHILNPSPIYRH
jgi:hypothetical protein